MSAGAQLARDVQRLMKGATANLTGRSRRGPDTGEGRRVPHRNSVDVNHPDANRWARIGDGSVAAGLAHREALVETAEQLRHQQWRENPYRDLREARIERDAAAAELAELETRSPAEVPVGRPAVLRQRLEQLDVKLEAADRRLRRTDITVLRALLTFLDFKTGRLFPAIASIAAKAGCHENTVKTALVRLKANGFIQWVRRTVKTGNDGEFAPQREQTSNAYGFDHRRQMAKATWSRFIQILTAKMRRVGRTVQGIVPPPSSDPAAPPAPGSLAETIASLGAAVVRAST